VARPARPIAAATRVATQAASAADSRCAHHGALGTRPIGGNHRLGRTRDRKALLREAGRPSRPLGRIPWLDPVASRRRLFAVGQPSADGVCPRRRGRCVAVAFIVRSSSRVPGLAQQGHDLALAILPCVVDGRLAPLGSKSCIGAAFEKALGGREVAVVCRGMQCCPIVDVLKTNERPRAE
jgi:hypothetical protein